MRIALLVLCSCAAIAERPRQSERCETMHFEATLLLRTTELTSCEHDEDCAELTPSLAGRCGVFVNRTAFAAYQRAFDTLETSCAAITLEPQCPVVGPACVESRCEAIAHSVVVDECDEATGALAAHLETNNLCERDDDCTMVELKNVLNPAPRASLDSKLLSQMQLACGTTPTLSASSDSMFDVSCNNQRCQARAPKVNVQSTRPESSPACLSSLFSSVVDRFGHDSLPQHLHLRTLISADGVARKVTFLGEHKPRPEVQAVFARGLVQCPFAPATREGKNISVFYVLNFSVQYQP